jgi:CubicO group peptidase (beta-lactamase class C family)
VTDGVRLPSVHGGSHWGGGLWMSTRDHARLGLLIASGGRWSGYELVPAWWIAEMLTPCPINPDYGLCWWLNSASHQFPGAPATSVAAKGAGSNVLWIDPNLRLVVVARWVDKPHVDGLIAAVVASVKN